METLYKQSDVCRQGEQMRQFVPLVSSRYQSEYGSVYDFYSLEDLSSHDLVSLFTDNETLYYEVKDGFLVMYKRYYGKTYTYILGEIKDF